ncbi:MAG: radical SAM protein [Desulfobacteraceae bacterium]|jgi:MoaA/NifB/PqqE/SkfB family radical SAM enzyme
MLRSINYKRLYSRFGLNIKYGFKWNKPLLLSRLAYNGFKLAMGRAPLLRTVDFAPTYACNYRCEHCFASKFRDMDARLEMTLDDYRSCADQCMDLGAVHFAFQGGEPLVLSHLEDIIRACSPSKNLIAITTNASLLTVKRIRTLKQAGVDLFTISLDSGSADKHDGFRGVTGAFKRAVQAAKDALDEGVNVTFNAVVTHQSLYDDGLMTLIRFTEKLGTKLNVLYAVPVGEWSENESTLLTQEDKNYVQTLFDTYPHLRRDLDANYVKYGCGAMKEVVYIDCYGDVMACPFIHASIGNCMDEPMVRIWRRGMEIDHFKGYAPVCLAAEDHHFIKEHLLKSCRSSVLPVPGKVMFPDMGKHSQDIG